MAAPRSHNVELKMVEVRQPELTCFLQGSYNWGTQAANVSVSIGLLRELVGQSFVITGVEAPPGRPGPIVLGAESEELKIDGQDPQIRIKFKRLEVPE